MGQIKFWELVGLLGMKGRHWMESKCWGMFHLYEKKFQVLDGQVLIQRRSLTCSLATGLCDYLKAAAYGYCKTAGHGGPAHGGSSPIAARFRMRFAEFGRVSNSLLLWISSRVCLAFRSHTR